MEVYETLKAALESEHGCLIGRNGQLELSLMIGNSNVQDAYLNRLELHAGVFPMPNKHLFLTWREESIRATRAADLLVTGWYKPLADAESAALNMWQVKAKHIPLRSLEPYYEPPENQWTSLLKDQDVAVISSFTKTASEQVKKGAYKIWGDRKVLDDTIRWHWIQTGHPPSVAKGSNEWPANISTWQDAAKYIVGEVVRSGARIVLIGCGGLSMPIANMLALRGHCVIVMGGAIQVLFGIKGKRWSTHPVISTFWNDAWVWPSPQETPAGAGLIEGGCYWA
jgi:hypothetical protein